MRRSGNGFLAVAMLLALCTGSPAWADYPLIAQLRLEDPVFKQLQQDLADSYRAESGGTPTQQLTVYRYRLPGDTDLFNLAAQTGIPYDALATINRFGNAVSLRAGQEVLLPGTAGIFLPREPSNDLEHLMMSWRPESAMPGYAVTLSGDGETSVFFFFPGSRFSDEERAFFLNMMFRFPLPVKRVTSPFGLRVSPISHTRKFHPGIDLAAPMGTPVSPARAGTVIDTGYNAVYGNYVIIQHAGGWQSVYGHLSSVAVRLNQKVDYGMILGTVGSTGESTGPHLHFEIRKRGVAQNPEGLMSGVKDKK